MGIEILKTPQAIQTVGPFSLPPEFDQAKFSASWVEETQVSMMKQRQTMPQCAATTDGLETFIKGDGTPHYVTTGNGKKYYLMFRAKVITDKMNAMYGNVSKSLMNSEVRGDTVKGSAPDPSILTEKHLGKHGGSNPTPEIPLNEVEEENIATLQ